MSHSLLFVKKRESGKRGEGGVGDRRLETTLGSILNTPLLRKRSFFGVCEYISKRPKLARGYFHISFSNP